VVLPVLVSWPASTSSRPHTLPGGLDKLLAKRQLQDDIWYPTYGKRWFDTAYLITGLCNTDLCRECKVCKFFIDKFSYYAYCRIWYLRLSTCFASWRPLPRWRPVPELFIPL
jgi:hypothetical protein